MTRKRIQINGARVLVMGLAFKENCPDLRNTRIVDIVSELREFDVEVDVYDPWVSAAEAKHEYAIEPVAAPTDGEYDGIVLAVAHRQFKALGLDAIRGWGRANHVLYDLKYVFDAQQSDLRL